MATKRGPRTRAPKGGLEPIAIIGMACRFPGADGPEKFWSLLRGSGDAITEVPADRWDADAFYSAAAAPRKMVTRWGGFLDGVDRFDAAFFRISPREAARMDPQQRLLLETAWEALEDAGQVPKALAGTRAGVFIGLSSSDYGRLQGDPSASDAYMPTGNAGSIAANRISFFFDLQGPSFVVDTACSSALVATHLACRSIWNGEASLALAGGVNVVLSPTNTINFSQAGMMSPDGRCKAFDASANGYVRGEGAGIVVLKPLSQAEADGDRIYALIRGSAVNQDGHTSSLTVPSQAAQERVTREACLLAGVSPGEIDYVEAHGTGTPVGDPIEARALGNALAQGRAPGSVCAMGSCKTNIGHLESAAGIAGVIKVALSLVHREIPASLHFHTPNPQIPFDELPLRMQKELGPWPDRGRPSLAGVNSFGFGGTNAHVVLEQYVGSSGRRGERPAAGAPAQKVFTLSAESSEGLKALADAHARALLLDRDDSSTPLHDLCYTASVRRTHHENRLAAVVRTREELADRLDAFLAGESRLGLYQGRARLEPRAKLTFVFPGQGSQWWGMGRALLEGEPVFRSAVEECDALFRRHAAWSLVDELRADEAQSRLHETEIAQPALFALQAGLAALWRSRGVVPDAVVGHSLGEVAAAHAAGILSLQDAVDVVFHRSRLMQQATGKGRMAAVELSMEAAEHALRGYEDRVSIAAANSPASVVLSGDPEPLEDVLQALQSRDVFFRYLPVNYAFHSHQMEPYLKELERDLQGLSPRAPSIPMFSTVYGLQGKGEDFGASYWVRNVRQTVMFSAAVAGLIEQGHRLFLELSPHPTLSGVIAQSLKSSGVEGTFIPSLRRGEEDEAVLMGGVGALYVSGFEIDWRRLYPAGGRCVDMPAYAWNRERHWLELTGGGSSWQPWPSASRHGKHPFLGRQLESAQPAWRTALTGERLDYLRDHQVQDSALLPAAAYLEMGLAAARESLGGSARALTDVEFLKPLLLPAEGETLVEIAVTPESTEAASFRVLSSRAADAGDGPSWTLHASGRIQTVIDPQVPPTPDPGLLAAIRERCSRDVPVEDLYRRLAHNGLQYGPRFRGIEKIWSGDGEALAYVNAPPELHADLSDYHVHPAVLDSCFQALAAAVDGGASQSGDLYLPTGVGRIRARDITGPAVWCHVRLVGRPDQTKDALVGEVRLMDDTGAVLVEVSGLRLQRLGGEARSGASQRVEDLFYELAWQPKLRPGQVPPLMAPEALPGPSDLHEQLERRLVQLTALKGLDRSDFDRWDRWGDAQTLLALRQLGWKPRIGDRFTTEELEAGLGVVPQHSRLFRRLLARLEEAGVLAQLEDGWTVSSVPEGQAADVQALFHERLAENPGAHLDLQLQQRCGSNLAGVLLGTSDPLELIFPDGSLAAAERFYQDSPYSSAFSLLIQQAVSAAVDRLSGGATLRILELGAGTGGTTAHILPRLPREGVEYVYTDISPLFRSHGEQKFASYSYCRFQSLDIEKDPVEQGYFPHSFDVIIASNVLHATNDLRRVLVNVKTLLADRGLLLLGELTGPVAVYDMVFALTGGWWRFQDFDLRPSYPLLSQDKWLRLLSEEGFTDASAVPEDARLRSKQTLLLARGPRVSAAEDAAAPIISFPAQPGTWLVFGTGEPLEIDLVALLRARDEVCLRVTPGEGFQRLDNGDFHVDPARPEDFQELIRQAPGCRGVIYLWGLNGIDAPQSAESLGAALDLSAGGALHLVQALASVQGAPPRLWFITRGVAPLGGGAIAGSVTEASLWGLARVLANEHPELRCTAVDLSPESASPEIRSLFEELWVDDREREVALRGSARYVHRAEHYDVRNHGEKRLTPRDGSFHLEVSRPGMFDSIVLRESERPQPGRGEVGVQVSASSLNFLDVLSALGLRPDQPARGSITEIGMECVGNVYAVGSDVTHVKVGDDVIVVAPYSLSSHVVSPASFVVRKPSGMSDEDAATIPVAFLTAFYALHHLGRIRKGERILIHAAAGGVGLAAVHLARRAGADVYVTAGSPIKREYLRALGLTHVMDSRSLAFADEIRELTGGTGVDLVLNSLAGEAISASLSLLRANGRFLEIGKKDIYQNSQLGLGVLRNNRSFHAIDLIPLFKEQPEFSGEMLREVVALFESGELRPLPFTAFPISQAEDAFRYMAQAKQIGKVVVTSEEQPVRVVAARPPAFALSPDATYLITGGLGGFGALVAEWMVERGARHLALMGRRGAQSEEASRLQKAMEQAGVRLEIARADVTNRLEVDEAIQRIETTMPPLRGVVHAAMVLEDAMLLQLSLASLRKVMGPKHVGAWNLHEATLGQPLDFFVLFGSLAALVGSPGQANYVAANAALDALAHYRRALGLPAIAIDWGRLGEVGYVARHDAIGERLDILGIKGMPPRQALDALERAIVENPVQVAIVDADWGTTRRMLDMPLLSALIPEDGGTRRKEADHTLRAALLVTEKSERQAIVESYIQNELARVLRMDPSRIDPAKRLTALGLDSLMAYELKARIESDMGVGLPMVKLVGGPSISELAAYLTAQVEATAVSTGTAATPHPAPPVQAPRDGGEDPILSELDHLSDEQVDSMLNDFSVDEQEALREDRP